LYRHIGDYEKAIEDFNRGEAIDSALWQAHVMGLFFQADTHARLGNESAAPGCCGRPAQAVMKVGWRELVISQPETNIRRT
jgi:hypothetical protein